MSHAEALGAYVGSFVDELALAGVRHVCVAPGSRSTPLALAFAEERRIKLWMQYDERSCAYFALGIARQLREPVAILCTSGTAAANFMPAVVEARYGRVPLVVLTADRPPELRDNGAAQTIDQVKLYGGHVKWAFDMPLPDAGLIDFARTQAARAVATAAAAPAGPVHLNTPFREPLIPALHAHVPARRPRGGVVHGLRGLDIADASDLVDELAAVERGVIVCGSGDDLELPHAATQLADFLAWPILADPLSGLRAGRHDRSLVVDSYDALLRGADFAARMAPDAVLRFGAVPTGRPLQGYVASARRLYLVDEAAGWNEPTSSPVTHIWATSESLAAVLPPYPGTEREAGNGSRPRREARQRSTWLATWLEAAAAARDATDIELSHIDEPFDGRAFSELADLLPDDATLVVGSSMPVRDLDTFFPNTEKTIRILASRGANGIDGVVSTAMGAAAVSRGPTVLAIGDLSFYHDMNGLLAAKLHGVELTVVLLNNDGGGIFNFLPQAEHGAHFETLFGTPHGLDFSHGVAMYGGRYRRVTDWPAFRDAVGSALRRPGLSVVELPTDRVRNVELHRQIWPKVAAAIRQPA